MAAPCGKGVPRACGGLSEKRSEPASSGRRHMACDKRCVERSDMPAIQWALGHADVATTMQYIGADDSDQGGAVDFVRY